MLQLSIKSQMSKSKPRTEYQVQYNMTDLWSRNQIHGHSCALQYKTTLKLTTNTFHKYNDYLQWRLHNYIIKPFIKSYLFHHTWSFLYRVCNLGERRCLKHCQTFHSSYQRFGPKHSCWYYWFDQSNDIE